MIKRRLISVFLSAVTLFSLSLPVFAGDGENADGETIDAAAVLDSMQETEEYWDAVALEAATGTLELTAKSAILMDASTGSVLYEHNPDEHLPIASVTKIMTILLICEALDRGDYTLDDVVTASTDASRMGGSQIYLKENEEMTVHDLLKATVVASANDAAYALAEFTAGSESAFVALMNKRAAELNMTGTLFANATGLPGEEHYSCARDVAIMSRELLRHEMIKEYTSIWMDYLRDGATQLVNTNKLIRHYKGATGLKTGSTDEAGCCISATAERNGMELIAVVLGSPTGAERFDDAKMLLDYGFLNYSLVTPELPKNIASYPVEKGEELTVKVKVLSAPSLLLEKGCEDRLSLKISDPVTLTAPVKKGQQVGSIKICLDDKVLAEVPVVTDGEVKKLTWWFVFSRMVSDFLSL